MLAAFKKYCADKGSTYVVLADDPANSNISKD
jgi:hypothetical protein